MRRFHSVINALMAVLLFPTLLLAQARVGVTGVVEDESRAAIPGATVTLVGQETGALQSTTSRQDGRFIFEDVSPAGYVVKVEMSGFETYHKALTVGPEPLSPLRIRLRLKAVEEDVTVEAEPTDKLSAAASNATTTKVDDAWLRDLPIASDDALAMIGRFISPAAQGAEGPSIIVDGIEVSQSDLPSAAISSVRINRNPYSPVFQHPGKGRIEVTTKRGHRSRRVDGALDLSARNSLFAARNAFAHSIPDVDRRLLQPSVGGALPGKNASFYLAAKRFVNEESAVVNAMTLTGPFVANVPAAQHHDNIFARVQWWPTALHSIYGTYGFSDHTFKNRGTGGFNLPERGMAGERHNHKVTVSDSAMLPPNWSNNLALGVTREEERAGTAATSPSIVVNQAFSAGPSQSFTQDTARTFDLDNTTTYYGRTGHTVLFGARVRADRVDALDASNFGGTFEFASLARFAAGAPLTFRINRGDPNIAFSVYRANGFLQDEIRVKPRLTLTLGLRYDWQSTTSDRNNVAPRFAFAFAPAKKTVVRGGAGIFYENLPLSATERSLLVDGVRLRQVVIAAPSFPDPFLSGQVVSPLPSIVRVAPDIRSPYLSQASLGVEQELWRRNSFTAEYSVLHGADLFRSRNINAPLPATGVRPDSAFLNVNEIESTASERSQALTVTWQGRVGKLFKPYAQYVFSHTTDDTSGTFSLPANTYDLRAERGPADADWRHRFNLIGILALPKAFQTGLVLSVTSGSPFNITTGFDNNGDTVANDRPAGVTRNTGRGPRTVQLDLRFAKTFNVAPLRSGNKRDSFDLIVDVFNAINRVNVTNIVGVLSSPFFGRANSASPARTMQFGVRYRFRR
jgi:outer membrane receptor protein involved in Fe transport